jgi:hypothetical protein
VTSPDYTVNAEPYVLFPAAHDPILKLRRRFDFCLRFSIPIKLTASILEELLGVAGDDGCSGVCFAATTPPAGPRWAQHWVSLLVPPAALVRIDI